MSRTYALWATAGHVDHGKTALLKALTGTDADRLPEEKKRGITIDIGFARFEEAGFAVSFVDVPGHEAFVKNMLAGVGSVDAVLLIVAADESVKPQTVEHLRIAGFLGIRHGIVALTKAGLADEETLVLAREEVADTVRGTFLENAPMFAVDSLSGAGVAELKAALLDVSRAIPARDAGGLFRLSVDRAFTVKGFGAVVTGSVASGEAREGQTLRLLPQGKDVRVRGIEVHGKKSPRARAGERAALNLQGVETGDIARGDMLVEGEGIRPTRAFDALVTLLPEAENLLSAKKGIRVRVHHMAAEAMGRLRPHGARRFAHVRLETPLPLAAGDRFVLRRYSPVETIGGGTVLDPHPPKGVRGQGLEISEEGVGDWGLGISERKNSSANPQTLNPKPSALLTLFASRAGERGVALADAAGRLALTAKETEALLPAEAALAGGRVFMREALSEIKERTEAALKRFHKENPMRGGMPREALRSEATPRTPSTAFDALLEAWTAEKIFASAPEGIRLVTHEAGLSTAAQKTADALEAAFRKAGLAPPPPEEIWKPHGKDGRETMHYLLKRGALVRVAEDYIIHTEAFAALQENLRALAKRKPLFDVADFKTMTNLSRKHAIPLLEHLDRAGVTAREGNARRLKNV